MRGRSGQQKNSVKIAVLGVLLVIAVVISCYLGRYPVPVKELGSILLSKIIPTDQFWPETMETVLFNIRLPRILLACLVGCCLSAAGASYQGIFQNPMAAPDILGASSGAAFGAAFAILHYATTGMITASAFLFSLLSVALVYVVSRKAGGSKILSLILSGMMISSLFTAGTSYIKLVADPTDRLPMITYWLIGSLSGATKKDVVFAIFPMAAGLVPLLLLRWRINILTFGDDEARTMGISALKIRLIVVVCASLVTAASVAVSGMIGWVGLVIPHLARRLVGDNYRHLMPASMLFGALFMLLIDDVSRNLLSTEIPIGILTAFIGAPFFIYLISREGVSR